MEVQQNIPPQKTLSVFRGQEEPAARSSIMLVEFKGKLHKVEFWSDNQWARLDHGERPEVHRACTDDGWFTLSSAPS